MMGSLGLFFRHAYALVRKEFRQILSEPAALLIGILMPMVLIILFGEAMSFDVRDVRLALVDTYQSAETHAYANAFAGNPTFRLLRTHSRIEADAALRDRKVEAVLVFEKGSDGFLSQLRVDAIDAPRAGSVQNAVKGVMDAVDAAHGKASTGLELATRYWFNETGQSRWFLVPGLFVIILTMTGTMLTSLVIAREWERGTMEAMLATPVSPACMILSKIVPYFLLGVLGWLLCMAAALFWYRIPIRGSFWLIAVSSCLYLWISLAIGLVISAATRSQFLASQASVLVSFLPALLLSGFIFDIRCMPFLGRALSWSLPPAHFLELLKIGFFTGGYEASMWVHLAMLLGFSMVFFVVLRRLSVKRIRN